MHWAMRPIWEYDEYDEYDEYEYDECDVGSGVVWGQNDAMCRVCVCGRL